MRASLDEKSIIKANAQFWEQMLAMSLEPMTFAGQFCVDEGHVQGTVTLSGAWNGRIEVRMDVGLAHQATSAMLMQPLDSVVDADTLDATKEIANMIAGVIKSSLPRPCSMTVPESAIETERFCGHASTEDSIVVAFHHTAGDMMVCVREQEIMSDSV